MILKIAFDPINNIFAFIYTQDALHPQLRDRLFMRGIFVCESYETHIIKTLIHQIDLFGDDVADFLFCWACCKTHVEGSIPQADALYKPFLYLNSVFFSVDTLITC